MADDTTTGDGDGLTLDPATPRRSGRGQRRALWAALAVVALAAGTVVVSTGGDEGPPVLPVSLSGGARELSADSAAGISLAWIRYVADDGLPGLGGEGRAHRLQPEVTTESVRTVAAALGLEGEIERDGLTWRVADGDRVLGVDERSGSWWYATAAADTPVASDGSAGSSGSDGSTGGAGGTTGCEPGTECSAVEPASPTTFPADCTPNGCPDDAIDDCPPGASCAPVEPAVEPIPPADCSQGRCVHPGDAPVDGCVEDCSTEPSEPCAEPDCVVTLPDEECPPGAACDPTGPPPEVILPEPAEDLPSEEEARSIALAVVRATGAEVEGARVTVDGPWDAWYVTVDAALDGVPVSGWSTSVAVGPDGKVLHGGGLLATTEVLGTYPLVDSRAAVDRLNALQGTGMGAPGVPVPTPDVGSSSPGGDTTTEQTAAVLCEDVPEDMEPYVGPCPGEGICEVLEDGTEVCQDPNDLTATTIVEPMPMPEPTPEPMPDPEPVEVVLTDAEQILLLLPPDDGASGAYLVPGYRMTSDDGHIAEVAAVTDELLSPTTVPETRVPAEPEEPVVTEPGPTTDCDVLVEDDGSGTTHTTQPCPPATTVPADDPQALAPGEAPEVGVPYYVDVDLSCAGGAFVLGQRDGIQLIWVLEKGDTSTWSTGHEGGTFTLDAEDHGTFVGDWEGTKQATFRLLGPAEDIFCTPQPRP